MKAYQVVAALMAVGGTIIFGASEVELRPDALNSSATCGECHEEIYAMWRNSMHSMAVTDPIFEVSYMQAYLETGGEARHHCLRCHAPAAVVSGDLELSEPISKQGVTCDFCHSVTSVDLTSDSPFRVSLDGIKRGPFADAESPVHGVAKSPLHESAEFCAGCHEYTNSVGTPVLSTYSEWRDSPQAAQGKTCQNCHMPLMPGNIVSSDLGAKPRENINLHNISGMHSSEQVKSAADAKILKLEREKDNIALVEVEVANVGSGHSIPTGLPTRKLILEVTLYSDGREVGFLSKEYSKKLLDERGHPIIEDHRAMMSAHRILVDTRLRAGERRLERFRMPVPKSGALSASITLRYLYEPKLLLPQKISIDIASDRSP